MISNICMTPATNITAVWMTGCMLIIRGYLLPFVFRDRIKPQHVSTSYVVMLSPDGWFRTIRAFIFRYTNQLLQKRTTVPLTKAKTLSHSSVDISQLTNLQL